MTKGNVLKVTELGIEDRVFNEMKKPTFSVEGVTRMLNEEGVAITAQSIRKFIKKSKKAQQELISRDLQTAEIYKKTIIDYGKELKSIMDEVKDVKERARNENDLASYNQMVGRLMQGIELIAKLTGDIKPKGSVDINLIYNEINMDMEKTNRHLKSEIFKNIVDVDSEIVNDDKEQEKNLR